MVAITRAATGATLMAPRDLEANETYCPTHHNKEGPSFIDLTNCIGSHRRDIISH